MEPSFTLRPLPASEPPARLYTDPRTLILDLVLAEYTALEAHDLDDAADLPAHRRSSAEWLTCRLLVADA
ncbi:hypothetical protein ACQPXB_08210 [Amycolatopsis sp. CA-161197]|uniref:hypothetical protein n=1 Tax=Amycolatopsis sp. CA-161197 TaxID=3239922 RepID=UPI003D93A9E6